MSVLGSLRPLSRSTSQIDAFSGWNDQGAVYDSTIAKLKLRQGGGWAMRAPTVAYSQFDYDTDETSRSTNTTSMTTLHSRTVGFTPVTNGVYWVRAIAYINYDYGGTSAWRSQLNIDGSITGYMQRLNLDSFAERRVLIQTRRYVAPSTTPFQAAIQWEVGNSANTAYCAYSMITVARQE